MSSSLRCGRIIYTNDLPIYAAFDEETIAYPGSLHADVPAALNAMLLDGRLDLSPVSAFAWAQNPDDLVLLPDLCIGARESVVSVVLVSQIAPSLLDGAQIALTKESASGRNLLRVILERRYGVVPHYVDDDDPLARATEGTPALLIGDAAIDALERFPRKHVYDMGTLWHEWTGQQTVFAVWAARREAYERDPEAVRACMHALTDAYTWSRSHMDQVIAFAQAQRPRAPGFYSSYYGKLNFTFHSAAQSGLAAYCRELHAIGAIAAVPSSLPEVIGVVSL
ncbi:MAG TPA: menaquinone biosynthesis protein [Candidatus Baltobacteraceae bacterium]|nr:menaquinone biosynthesis protein [Candidatus Baltobacteraceae bacterium]